MEKYPFLKSAIIGNHNNRRHFAPTLIKRLQNIPQLLPVGCYPKTRNRYQHVINMLKILDALKLNSDKKEGFPLFQRIKLGIIAHDLGHPNFGHAGEREINRLMKGYGEFSNSIQSEKLLYFERSEKNQFRLETIFDTPPFESFLSFDKSNLLKKKSVNIIVDFLDDLENAFGDLTDLWLSFKNEDCKKTIHQLLRANTVLTGACVVSFSLAYLSIKKIPLRSTVDSLCLAVQSDVNQVHSDLINVRKMIKAIAKNTDIICQHDEKGAILTKEFFIETKDKLAHYYNFSNEFELLQLTADLTAAQVI
jgi:hypothetical protein